LSPTQLTQPTLKTGDNPVACGKLLTYCDSQPYRCSIKKLFMDMPGQFDHISRQSISKKMDVVFSKSNKPCDPSELNPAALKKAKLDPAAMMAAARAGGNLKSDDEGKYIYCVLLLQTVILTLRMFLYRSSWISHAKSSGIGVVFHAYSGVPCSSSVALQ
jgi:hypothetical protein